MTNNYFRVGRTCIFFDDTSESAVKQAYEAARKLAAGVLAVWRLPMAGLPAPAATICPPWMREEDIERMSLREAMARQNSGRRKKVIA